jgi:DNA-binding NarL/FixJ family response regulator
MATSKVVIDIIAPNSRTFNMLEFVLQQHGKGRFELSRGNRPDLVVVDFDKSDVQTTFRKFRSRFPEIPAVLLLNQLEEYQTLPSEDRIGAEYLLLKPFAAKDFIAKINECLGGVPAIQANGNSWIAGIDAADRTGKHTAVPARTEQANLPGKRESQESPRSIAVGAERTIPLQTSSTGIQAVRPVMRQRSWEALEKEEVAYPFALESDIDMADDAAVENIWLKTDNKLLGYFNSAISQQKSAPSAICLFVHEDLKFYISPYAKTVAVAGESFNLLELARQDFGNRQISVSQSAMPDKDVILQLELEAFLWKLALYTYRGYLPAGINVNKPVYLKYWPNLTRLEPTPNAMRIASLLSRQPVALAFIVRILNIPQKHVFNFYAAANASGFAGPAVREVDNMLLPSYPDELGYSPVQGYIDKTSSKNTTAC